MQWLVVAGRRISCPLHSPDAVPALAVALNDEEPLVRGYAAWALGGVGTAEAARQAPRGREEVEADAWVREEIGAAFAEIFRNGGSPPAVD